MPPKFDTKTYTHREEVLKDLALLKISLVTYLE